MGDTPEAPRSRELRKGFGERAHSSPVVSLACAADGQLVWSASGKGVLLWDAACGAFLGMLQRCAPRFTAQPSQSEMQLAGADINALKYKIDAQKVRQACIYHLSFISGGRLLAAERSRT